MKIRFVDLIRQNSKLRSEVNLAVQNVIKSSSFILGEELIKFEEEYANYCNAKYAVGVDSGVSALELGIRALGIKEDDEVITPANSFIASSSAISFCGAKPVLVDCDSKTYNIDPLLVEKSITRKTKAIMAVHLYGQPADMESIKKVAKKYQLSLIEDACQAHGAKYKGKRVGTFGDFAAFSFYPSKNLGAFGDGGIVVTNSKKIEERVKIMRNYGQRKKYDHEFLAWNRRLDSLQAAVLRIKLKYLDNWNKVRQESACLYTERLRDLPVVVPAVASYSCHVFHLYVIQTSKRNELKEYLLKEGVETGIHYPIPIHLQKAYKCLNYKSGDFPKSELLSKRAISLPIYPEMKDEEIVYVVEKIKKFFS